MLMGSEAGVLGVVPISTVKVEGVVGEDARTDVVGVHCQRGEREMRRTLLRYRLLAILLFLGELSYLTAQSPVEEEKALPVSLIRLIASPEKFDGRRLRVIGVLDYGGGADKSVCLYFSEIDARNAVMSNCISLDQSVDKGDERLGKYVILNATFHYDANHGLEYLSFKRISDMKLWPPRQEKKE